MSDSRFVFSGLDELREALRSLPAELAADAATAVTSAAQAAESDARAVYEAHRHSGNLIARLSRTTSTSAFGASAVVKNTAKHAWIFENGSEARHYTTASGATHATGEMWGKTPQPPTHVFVRAMQAHRQQMYDWFVALLERQGLQVTGEP
jgi:hypothetical protein